MKIDDLLDLLAMLDEEQDELLPAIEKGCELLLTYGSKLSPLMEAFRKLLVAHPTALFNDFIMNGFTREEAMLLLLDHEAAMTGAIRSLGNKGDATK